MTAIATTAPPRVWIEVRMLWLSLGECESQSDVQPVSTCPNGAR